jgi:hypothetical protein
MKRSGQAAAPVVLVIAGVVGGLYLLGVQVHKGVKHLGCVVTTGHKCGPKTSAAKPTPAKITIPTKEETKP